jgi:hypothetical protein
MQQWVVIGRYLQFQLNILLLLVAVVVVLIVVAVVVPEAIVPICLVQHQVVEHQLKVNYLFLMEQHIQLQLVAEVLEGLQTQIHLQMVKILFLDQ